MWEEGTEVVDGESGYSDWQKGANRIRGREWIRGELRTLRAAGLIWNDEIEQGIRFRDEGRGGLDNLCNGWEETGRRN